MNDEDDPDAPLHAHGRSSYYRFRPPAETDRTCDLCGCEMSAFSTATRCTPCRRITTNPMTERRINE